MKFTVPYLYKFWYVPSKCQNDREAFGRATMEVEIAELGDSDAPVVMTVANPSSGQMSQKYSRFLARPDGTPRRVRMRDGLFYVEGFPVEEFVERASNLATLNTTFLSWIGKHEPSSGEIKNVHHTITSVRDLRWSRNVGGLREDKTRDDGGAKVGAKIAKQAAKMLLIDGVTYERCREPILSIVIAKGKEPDYGVVEAYKSLDDRLGSGKYANPASYTSSLVHADRLMQQTGVDPSVISYEVVDRAASSYDGVASDMICHLTWASEKLKGVVRAAPLGTLQAYYRVREALEHVDHGSPSVSAEIVAAAQGILDIAVDPDIDEPMRELANARWMTDTSGRSLPGGNPNEGGPFFLGLGHVSDYRDIHGYADSARFHAELVLDRWEGRHPQSTFDNGQTQRMTSRVGNGITVAEIGSDAQARLAARELGVEYALVDSAIDAGSRIFRLSAETHFADTSISDAARSGVVGMVIGPQAGMPDGHWKVVPSDHPKAGLALQAVGEHVEAMDERDMELSQDQQLISIF
ncbi:hypothetical protein GOB57_21040 [Sinorhizobium meliloti]|nr:hypothetical protein [Sinorhizobium meliloti]